MPTDAFGQLLALIDRYGLPLFALLGLGFLVWRGILRFGPDVDRVIAEQASQISYVEDRRKEERVARLEAEERLESNNATLREATAGFREANGLMKELMEAAKKR